MITKEELKEKLLYCEDGSFVWKIAPSRNRKAGSIAGSSNSNYCYIRINRILYMSHKLVWLYHYGVYPEEDIAHRSGNTKDNRLSNLKLTTASESQLRSKIPSNNTSGYKGVSYIKSRGLFEASVRVDGKKNVLGYFEDVDDAHLLCEETRKQLLKEKQC